jgi:hypothetical protein
MAAKGKTPAKKKAYKKPTADKLNDKDLNRVTGGEQAPLICKAGPGTLFCSPVGAVVGVGGSCVAGGAAALKCEPAGGAATLNCSAGGAVARSCTHGGTHK